MYNKLYTLIFEKENSLDPSERFVFQFLETIRTCEEGKRFFLTNLQRKHIQ